MRSIGNVLWHFPFLGFLTSLGTFLMGGFFVITVVGAPIGLGLIQFAKFLMSPYSHAMISKSEIEQYQSEDEKDGKAWKIFSLIATILWLPFGVFSAIAAGFQGIFCCFTIVGIPVGLVILKSVKVYLNPVNKICVPVAVADELEKRKDKEDLKKYNLAS